MILEFLKAESISERFSQKLKEAMEKLGYTNITDLGGMDEAKKSLQNNIEGEGCKEGLRHLCLKLYLDVGFLIFMVRAKIQCFKIQLPNS